MNSMPYNISTSSFQPMIMVFIIALLFSVGYIATFHQLWNDIFLNTDNNREKKIIERIILVLISDGAGIYLYMTAKSYFEGNVAVAFYAIALFLIISPFFYQRFNLFEKSIQVITLLSVWYLYHYSNATELGSMVGLIGVMLILILMHFHLLKIAYTWYYELLVSIGIYYLFFGIAPHVTMGVSTSPGMLMVIIIVFPILMTASRTFWLRNYKDYKNNLELEKLADYDALTKVKSYSLYQRESEKIFENAKNKNHNLIFIELDIDYFKQINDHYGHEAGNSVLIDVTRTLIKTMRKYGGNDKTMPLYRTGGEEFTILIKNKSLDESLEMIESFWNAISEKEYQYEDAPISLSISMGISELNEQDEEIATMYKRADMSLYKSKNNGRNQITIEGVQKFSHSKETNIITMHSFCTQKIVNLNKNAADEDCMEITLWTYNYVDSNWELSENVYASIEMKLELTKEVVNERNIKDIVFGISKEQFMHPDTFNMLDEYLRSDSNVAKNITLRVKKFDEIDDTNALKIMIARYHELNIKIMVDSIKHIKIDDKMLEQLASVDMVKYNLGLIRNEKSEGQIMLDIERVQKITNELNIEFLLAGINFEEEYRYANEHLNIELLQGNYFGMPSLPVFS